MNNIKLFFAKLSTLNPKSLNNTRDILNLREKIISKISELKLKYEQNIPLFKDLREKFKNKSKKIITKEYKLLKEDLPPGKYAINCLKCSISCDSNFKCSDEMELIKKSPSIDSNGFCTICHNKFNWDDHRLFPYLLKIVEVEKEQTLEDLKKKNIMIQV